MERYVTSANVGSDTSVAAMWVVPQLTCSTVLPAAASQWVGLGGVNYKEGYQKLSSASFRGSQSNLVVKF